MEADPIADPDLIAKYPNVKGDNANLIREIRRERRIELFAEGYRWDDVCRWNVGEVVFNRVRRGAKMDPNLYSADEIKTIKDQVGFVIHCEEFSSSIDAITHDVIVQLF